MNDPLLSRFVVHMTVALLLFVAVMGFLRMMGRPLRRGPAFGVLWALCLAATWARLLGLDAAGWWSGIVPGLSIPTLALLVHAGLRLTGRVGWLRNQDLAGLYLLGAVAGLILYPAALGWSAWDPYAAGWMRSWVVLAGGFTCGVACLLGNRLGWVLLATVAAWRLGLLESRNYWDYLVDPLFFVLALAMCGWTWMRRGGCVADPR